MKACLLSAIFLVCVVAVASTVEEKGEGDQKWASEHVQAALEQKAPLPWKKNTLVVPSAEVATAIHSAVAGAVFGQANIEKERPFRAVHYKDFWVVFGPFLLE